LVAIDDDGRAEGTLTGALELTAYGLLDAESLRMRLEPALAGPEAGDSFAGTLVAHGPANGPGPASRNEAPSLLGRLRLSSGDSLLVRTATLRLEPVDAPH
jgi:hypothetical protein